MVSDLGTRLLAGQLLAVRLFNIELIGLNWRTGKKVLFTTVLFLLVYGVRTLALAGVRRMVTERPDRAGFWSRQGIQLIAAIVLLLGIASIWIDRGTNLTTGLGLISAGLAFALQQVVTAVAGYFVILRGDTFNVGDRITIGGVRGDVIRLGFIKTTVMEMGQPPSIAESTDPALWVHSRQYTGRLVTVSNGQVFAEPVYNYSRDFPYLWEELVVPITYDADRQRTEAIMLEAARHHATPAAAMSQDALEAMRSRYAVSVADIDPHVYLRITDNWLELSLRFVVPDRGIRAIKDAMSRQILDGLDAAGIGIASATYDIVGLPEVRLVSEP